MGGDLVAVTARNALERGLESEVFERLHLSAAVAHEVVMVLASGMRGLEAGDPVTEVDALHETGAIETLERSIDASDPEADSARADSVVDLLGRDTARLMTDELDDGTPRCAASPGRLAKPVERVCRPVLAHER